MTAAPEAQARETMGKDLPRNGTVEPKPDAESQPNSSLAEPEAEPTPGAAEADDRPPLDRDLEQLLRRRARLVHRVRRADKVAEAVKRTAAMRGVASRTPERKRPPRSPPRPSEPPRPAQPLSHALRPPTLSARRPTTPEARPRSASSASTGSQFNRTSAPPPPSPRMKLASLPRKVMPRPPPSPRASDGGVGVAPPSMEGLGRMAKVANAQRDSRQDLIGQTIHLPPVHSSAGTAGALRRGRIEAYRLINGEEIWQVIMLAPAAADGEDTAAQTVEQTEQEEEFFFRAELDKLLQKTQGGGLLPTTSMSDEQVGALHKLVSGEWFDRVVLTLIFFNCIVMVLQKEWAAQKDLWTLFERIFLGCFLCEMLLKMCAFGLCSRLGKPPGYFRDAWNWLDFVIVMEGVFSTATELLGDGGEQALDLSLLRIVRTLRPLRAVTRLPELRVLVEALFSSIPFLGTTVLVGAFYLLIFGIAGVQFWQGLYRNRCFTLLPGDVVGELVESDELACGARECGLGQICAPFENPNGGITSFDNLLVAWLTIFQAITLEGWVDIMNVGLDSLASEMWIYFILMLLFGTFIMLNLSMAIIVARFKEGKVKSDELYHANQRRADRRTDARRKWRRAGKLEEARSDKNGMTDRLAKVASQAKEAEENRRRAEIGRLSAEWKAVDTDGSGHLDREEVRAVLKNMGRHVNEMQLDLAVEEMDEDDSGHIDYDEFEKWWDREMLSRDEDRELFAAGKAWPEPCMRFLPWAATVRVAEAITTEMSPDGFKVPRDRFDQAMCGFILGNMVVLSLDHYDPETGVPVEMNKVLDKVNLGFTILFMVEMGIKIIAQGFRGYISSPMNCLDAFSVLTGLMEKSMTSLRAIRFLRLVRLARHLKSMQQIVTVLTKAWKSIFYITGLLLLFIFIFTMAGMQLFGGKLIEDGEVPRNNYDSFHWAFVSVFQVLQGENWPAMLFTGIHSIGWGTAVPFYLLWVIVGTLVILNLFLAVVMAYFEELEEDPGEDEISAFRAAFDKICAASKQTKNSSSGGMLSYQQFEILFDRMANQHVTKAGSKTGTPRETRLDHFRAHRDTVFASVTQWARKQAMTTSLDMGASVDVESSREASVDDVLVILADLGFFAERTAIILPKTKLGRDGKPVESNSVTREQQRVAQVFDTLLQRGDGDLQLNGSVPSKFDNLAEEGGRITYKCTINLLEELGVVAEPEPASLIPETQEEQVPSSGNMLCCIPAGSCFHQCCKDLVLWPWFDRVILVLICISSVALAVDHPAISDEMADALSAMDLVFTILFSAELIVKVCAYGLALHPHAYLRSSWNILDCVVVTASIVNILANALDLDFSWLRAARLLRALRPLRMVARNEGMRIICNALILSLGAILNVGVVLAFVWFMFALIGVQFFKGQMYRCSDSSFPEGAYRYGVENATAAALGINGTGLWEVLPCTAEFGRSWVRDEMNFDSLPRALLSLYIFATGEGWPDAMFSAADTVGIDYQPRRDASPMAAYYFVLFCALTSFFFMELFVGAICQRFFALKQEIAKQGGALLLTDTQREWIVAQKRLLSVGPTKPPDPMQIDLQSTTGGACCCIGAINCILRFVNRLVISKNFDHFILGCIILNMVVMASSFVGQPQWWDDTLSGVNTVLTFVFAGEAALKLLGLGLTHYFQSRWNIFDFTIVAGSLIDLMGLEFINTSMFRVFRVARVVRAARSLKGLQRIMQTLLLSIPALLNVGTLLFLLLFVYATLGVALFGKAPRRLALLEESPWLSPSGGLDAHSNFETWGSAMLLLIRTLTGEDWQTVMFDCSRGGAAAPPVVWTYFVSYAFLSSFVLINLFVMIIADNFEQQSSGGVDDDDGPTEAASLLAHRFVKAWAQLDPFATKYVERTQVPHLLRELVTPPNGKQGVKLPGLNPDDNGQLSDSQLKAFEKRLRLNYWCTPQDDNAPLGPAANRSGGADTAFDPIFRSEVDLEAGDGDGTAMQEWVHFSQVLDRLHVVAFEDLYKELPPRAKAKLPTKNFVKRIESETLKRMRSTAKSVQSDQAAQELVRTGSATPRVHKHARLAHIASLAVVASRASSRTSTSQP